jgi:hypothetical protein
MAGPSAFRRVSAPNSKALITVREASELLGVSESWVRRHERLSSVLADLFDSTLHCFGSMHVLRLRRETAWNEKRKLRCFRRSKLAVNQAESTKEVKKQ